MLPACSSANASWFKHRVHQPTPRRAQTPFLHLAWILEMKQSPTIPVLHPHTVQALWPWSSVLELPPSPHPQPSQHTSDDPPSTPPSNLTTLQHSASPSLLPWPGPSHLRQPKPASHPACPTSKGDFTQDTCWSRETRGLYFNSAFIPTTHSYNMIVTSFFSVWGISLLSRTLTNLLIFPKWILPYF